MHTTWDYNILYSSEDCTAGIQGVSLTYNTIPLQGLIGSNTALPPLSR